jgi:hypothetical protein
MKLASFAAASSIVIFAACKTVTPTSAPTAKILSNSKLASFASEAEFQEYMTNLGKGLLAKQRNQPKVAYSKYGEPEGASANDSITNNQELGVDEGGIVKNIGEHLVVLHKGRLSVVSVADGQLKETDSIYVPRVPELQKNVWYDELLVNGDQIYVIGYRYHATGNQGQLTNDPCKKNYIGATEVNSYTLKEGKLQRLHTRFIESSDYYSGENYASRMVDGRLVFYMPHPAFNFCDDNQRAVAQMPQELNFDLQTGFSPIKPLLAGTDVYKNIDQIERSAMLHTVVSCGLPADGTLDCKAKAVLGDYSRDKYVTKDFVYLATANKIYALGLKDLFVRAHASAGTPVNQFSFRESSGTLTVITEDYGSVDPSTQSVSSCTVKLLKLPLAYFDAAGTQDISQLTTVLHQGQHCSVSQNRFVGRHAIIARYGETGDQQELMAVDTGSGVRRVQSLAGYVGRIEVLSDEEAFLTIRRNDGNLEAVDLRLDLPDLKITGLRMGRSAEGESRSHGFFQKSLADGSHLVGLPVLTLKADPAAWWGHGLSNVAFIRINGDDSIKLIGTVESGKDISICQSSCVDWYGNTRPIFLKDRLFALMGHELAEVKLSGETLAPAGRVQMFGQIRL